MEAWWVVCNKCYRPLKNSRSIFSLTECQHIFCSQCALAVKNNHCPECNEPNVKTIALQKPLQQSVLHFFGSLPKLIERSLQVAEFQRTQALIVSRRYREMEQKYEEMRKDMLQSKNYMKSLAEASKKLRQDMNNRIHDYKIEISSRRCLMNNNADGYNRKKDTEKLSRPERRIQRDETNDTWRLRSLMPPPLVPPRPATITTITNNNTNDKDTPMRAQFYSNATTRDNTPSSSCGGSQKLNSNLSRSSSIRYDDGEQEHGRVRGKHASVRFSSPLASYSYNHQNIPYQQQMRDYSMMEYPRCDERSISHNPSFHHRYNDVVEPQRRYQQSVEIPVVLPAGEQNYYPGSSLERTPIRSAPDATRRRIPETSSSTPSYLSSPDRSFHTNTSYTDNHYSDDSNRTYSDHRNNLNRD